MNKRKLITIKTKGLSLLEVLTVLIIIGLTSLVVIKNLSPTVNKVKKKEANIQLKHLHTLQQTYFMEFNKYTSNLEDLGYTQLPLSTEGGEANYRIEIIEASPSSYKATATSVVDFNQNGTMDVWEIDQSGKIVNIVKD